MQRIYLSLRYHLTPKVSMKERKQLMSQFLDGLCDTMQDYTLEKALFTLWVSLFPGYIYYSFAVMKPKCGSMCKTGTTGYSAWRREMLRNFSDLISANELNINAREYIEERFRMMKDNITFEVGPYYVDNSENEVGSSNIKDPKSIIKIKRNQAMGKKKSVLTHASRIKTSV
ncbi:hypothetical protein M9H77_09285 [Catharanthus roseus]|uniref:Uncharacterized protein n=1 Tax=Catharanthus roseus TaxID=4058 RepID=A0ACC0C077_CATRO|nr:hypothetical protein M9H77_09285 [Catharanthus roseus]